MFFFNYQTFFANVRCMNKKLFALSNLKHQIKNVIVYLEKDLKNTLRNKTVILAMHFALLKTDVLYFFIICDFIIGWVNTEHKIM